MSTDVEQGSAQRWDARMLEKIQGGKVEKPEQGVSRRWLALIHLPLLVTWLASSPASPIAIGIACFWAVAIAINVGMWLRKRRARRRSAAVGNPFGR